MMSSVSVIIPTFHAPNLIATLQALQSQTAWSQILEILVVGQQDHLDLSALPKVKYLHVEDRPTPARNRNQGAACAQGEWFCFTDSDCVPARDWVQQMLLSATAYNANALYGTVTFPSETTYWDLCDHLLIFGVPFKQENQHVKSAATLNFCIRAALFAELGGFDEAFPSAAGEDLDFSYRLQRAGHQISSVPLAFVEHQHNRQTLGAVWQHVQRYGEATVQFRSLRGMDWRWRLARGSMRLPLIGEMLVGIRVSVRAALRAGRYVVSCPQYLWALPGVAILDLAHSLGIVHQLRRKGEK